MKVALPSGHEAELRDQILAGDKRAANAAIEVHMDSEGGRVVSVSMTDNVKYALLTRLIVSWDVGQPPPSMVVDPVGLLDSLPWMTWMPCGMRSTRCIGGSWGSKMTLAAMGRAQKSRSSQAALHRLVPRPHRGAMPV